MGRTGKSSWCEPKRQWCVRFSRGLADWVETRAKRHEWSISQEVEHLMVHCRDKAEEPLPDIKLEEMLATERRAGYEDAKDGLRKYLDEERIPVGPPGSSSDLLYRAVRWWLRNG